MRDYVEQVVDERIEDSECLMAIPATVKKLLSNGICLVQLIANDTELTVPNWSGCDVSVGDEVRLFYTGSVIADRTAYIGAAAYITNRQWSCVKGNFIKDDGRDTRTIPISGEANISKFGFKSTHAQTVLVTFNGKLVGATGIDFGVAYIKLYVDNVRYDFDYSISIQSGMLYCPIISLPFDIEEGRHTVEIKVSGTGITSGTNVSAGWYTNVCSYVTGQGLTDIEIS